MEGLLALASGVLYAAGIYLMLRRRLAQLDTLDGYQELIQRTGKQKEAQFRLAESYRAMSESQQHTATDFEAADDALYRANRHAEATRDEQAATVAVLTAAADARQVLKDRLDVLLTRASKEA